MKIAVFIAATLLFGPALRSQDLSLVEPGDILVLKFVPVKPVGATVTKVLQVTSEGKLVLPSVEGTKPNDLTVQGLSMDEVSENANQAYGDFRRTVLKVRERSFYAGVIVERGTVAQLLGQ